MTQVSGDAMMLGEDNTNDEGNCLNEEGKPSDEKKGGQKEQKNPAPAKAKIKEKTVLDESVN